MMKLTLEKILSVEKTDLSRLQKILSEEKVRLYLPFQNEPSFKEVENLVSHFLTKNNHIWKIADHDKLIGIIDLSSIDDKTVSLAYILQCEYWGQGIMNRFLKEVMEYCFYVLKIEKINAPVVSRNRGSSKLLQKNGFKEMERLEKKFNFDGADDDVIIYSLNKKTIYVSDLDSTLLQPDATLSPFAVKNLNNLISKGVLFTVASARSIKSILPLFEKVKLKLPIIELNGTFVSDPYTGKHLVDNTLDDILVQQVTETLHLWNQNYFLSTFNGNEDRLYYSEIFNRGEQWYVDNRIQFKDNRLTRTKNLTDHNHEDVACITVIDCAEKLISLKEKLSRRHVDLELIIQANHNSPGWFWLSIQSTSSSKDRGILSLLAHKKIHHAEIVAFGDNTNDVKMIKNAHKGIAVGNALDIVKNAADLIIGPNTDDSVIKFIAEDSGIGLI